MYVHRTHARVFMKILLNVLCFAKSIRLFAVLSLALLLVMLPD
jgi:hypothetical protein